MKNEVSITIGSEPENEAFARMAVAYFVTRLNPTLEEISDIKTAVSEAVTNSILHGYYDNYGEIHIICRCEGNNVEIEIKDYGVGIEDIERAMEPMYTTKPELDRSGLGFVFMQTFMDEVAVDSAPGKGTTVIMKKRIANDMENDEGEELAVGFN